MISPKPHLTVLLSLLLSLLLPTTRGVLDYSAGFPCNDNSISLNPGPRAFPRLVETTTDDSICLLRMSPDQIGRSVSAFASYTLDNDDYAFDTTFTYQLSGVMNGIGDGIAFVIHQDSSGKTARGGGGGDLGVYGGNMITPAIVVELDTFRNQFGLPADEHTSAVHVTIVDGGDIFKVQEVPTTVRGGTFTVNIQSDGQTLKVFVNGNLRVSQCVNPSEHFSGSRNVVVGFTGGTGIAADQQDIFTWVFNSAVPAASIASCGVRTPEVRPPSPAPVPTPPVPAPTNAPSRMPSSTPSRMPSAMPSMGPTSQQDRLVNLWVFLMQIIEALTEYLAALGAIVPDNN